MKISIMWSISLILTGILLFLATLTKKESKPEKEMVTPFECGFNVMNPSHVPFSFQFFIISLLFLIFDIEIALILSYPIEPKANKTSIIIIVFLTTLIIGLFYEWQKKKIEWSKWMEKLIPCKK